MQQNETLDVVVFLDDSGVNRTCCGFQVNRGRHGVDGATPGVYLGNQLPEIRIQRWERLSWSMNVCNLAHRTSRHGQEQSDQTESEKSFCSINQCYSQVASL